MARARCWLLVGLVGVVPAGCSDASADRPASATRSTTTTAVGLDVERVVVSTSTVAKTVTPSTAAVGGLPSTVVPAAPVTSTMIPAPCDVVAVGDSVGIDLFNNGLRDRLAFAGCDLKWTGGRRGITVTDGADALASASGITADVALVILGYHDAKSETQAGRFPSLIDTVMAAAGPRLVVWPMLGATDDCSDNYKIAVGVANASLQEATTRWPNLLLVDYTSLLAAHPEYSQDRCPHLLASGSTEVAGWLAGQLREAVNSATPLA